MAGSKKGARLAIHTAASMGDLATVLKDFSDRAKVVSDKMKAKGANGQELQIAVTHWGVSARGIAALREFLLDAETAVQRQLPDLSTRLLQGTSWTAPIVAEKLAKRRKGGRAKS